MELCESGNCDKVEWKIDQYPVPQENPNHYGKTIQYVSAKVKILSCSLYARWRTCSDEHNSFNGKLRNRLHVPLYNNYILGWNVPMFDQ